MRRGCLLEQIRAEAQVTGPDENIAAALRALAEQQRKDAEVSDIEPSSTRKSEARREKLHQIAQEMEVLAENSRSASYQIFARLLDNAKQAGVAVANETVFAVGRAFVGRSYVRPSPSADQ
jgi:hypothetical protein